jgi:hypothetical protein
VEELAGQRAGRRQSAERAQQIAIRRFNLDDLGAKIGKPAASPRADHDRRQIENLDSGQGIVFVASKRPCHRVSAILPNRLGGLHHKTQLRRLLVDRHHRIAHVAGEAALRTKAQAIERNMARRLLTRACGLRGLRESGSWW